jgi:diguanylate cyclase (GGDEF)-like protein
MPHLTQAALRSPGSAHDLFILGATLLACFVFALEYELIQSAETMTPQQRRISLAEIFALAGVLTVGLIVFAARRLTEQRVEFERRLAAEREMHTVRRQANSDSLTGLPNRRALTAALDAHLKDGAAAATHALMLLDLNRFKAINDRHGHPVGDKVLESIGQRMKAVVNDHHFAARLGGDEFAIFCPDTSDPEVARGRTQAIIDAIEKPIVIDGIAHSVGVSVGIAFYPRNAATRTDLMRSADDALYRAKTESGSAIRFAE